ncbi:unnamed protein product [Fusarium fujikuroi]|nr:unnamed protein product [Fusarium fujikuroi]
MHLANKELDKITDENIEFISPKANNLAKAESPLSGFFHIIEDNLKVKRGGKPPLNQSNAGKREAQRDRISSILGKEKGPYIGIYWKLLERLPSLHTNIKSYLYRDVI